MLMFSIALDLCLLQKIGHIAFFVSPEFNVKYRLFRYRCSYILPIRTKLESYWSRREKPTIKVKLWANEKFLIEYNIKKVIFQF